MCCLFTTKYTGYKQLGAHLLQHLFEICSLEKRPQLIATPLQWPLSNLALRDRLFSSCDSSCCMFPSTFLQAEVLNSSVVFLSLSNGLVKDISYWLIHQLFPLRSSSILTEDILMMTLLVFCSLWPADLFDLTSQSQPK